MNNQHNSTTHLGEVVASTVQGLRQLESMLGYEFNEAIYHIEKLYDIKTNPLKSMLAYDDASNPGRATDEGEVRREYA